MKYQLRSEAAFRKVGDTVFVVTADRALHKMANPAALTLFQALQRGPATLEELTAALVRQFDVDAATAADDAQAFMITLVERKLVAADDKTQVAQAD